jgi:serine hydrolase
MMGVRMKFFLFHCWGGDGRSCWSGWLQDELRRAGHEVHSPTFPSTDNPKLHEWLAATRKEVPRFDAKDDWVLAGHSLGCPTILRLLESFNEGEKARAAILVAGFAKDLGIPQIRNFVDRDFGWERIRGRADRFVAINSDDDPFIPLSEGERLSGLLKAEFIVEKGAGHINEGSGFSAYPRLLEIINRIK